MKIQIRTIVTALALAASVSAFAADPIKIGVSGPFTGGSSPMGISMLDGVKLATAEINAKGGVLGRKIQLIERDDQADNSRGLQVTQELVNREGVVASVGFINSGVSLTAQRVYEEAKIPVINNVATATQITKQFLPPDYPDNYVFRTSANDTIQSAMIVHEAIDSRKFTKVAILADSTNYGQLGRADLEKALAAKGIKPVAVEKFNIKDTDMTAQLLKSKEAGAQAILTYGIGPELAQIANGMEKLGWKVPMIGSWTLSMGNFIDNAGKNGDGAMMPETFIQLPNTPKRKAFIAAYLKAYKPANGRIPSPVSAAQGYDSMYILAAAINQAGNTNGVKIREALENLNAKIDGVVTNYDHPFTHDDHEAITQDMVVMGVVKDGQVVHAHDADKAGKK
ncbi:MAG TPA: ABC transporter substrate-binding protein [Gallionella sp.]|nr:ABC transporter substrate-binding protein [Gallionella sp.]